MYQQFIQYTEQYSIGKLTQFIYHSPVNGHLGCSQFLAIKNKAAITICGQKIPTTDTKQRKKTEISNLHVNWDHSEPPIGIQKSQNLLEKAENLERLVLVEPDNINKGSPPPAPRKSSNPY